MDPGYRERAARYYDLFADPYDDVSFYRGRLQGPAARVLELGCGTGRVLLPLAASCGFIQGVDHSPAMLDLCRRKLDAARVPAERARVEEGDITDLRLGGRFDLITAPFRVMQNLETDEQVDGLFATIRRHLKPGGEAILNVFNPNTDRASLIEAWAVPRERLSDEKETPDGTIRLIERLERCQTEPLVLYPDLIYQLHRDGRLVDEAVLRIAMRCYYPDELIGRITSYGFTVTGRWGGYDGQIYGEGPELVVAFTA